MSRVNIRSKENSKQEASILQEINGFLDKKLQEKERKLDSLIGKQVKIKFIESSCPRSFSGEYSHGKSVFEGKLRKWTSHNGAPYVLENFVGSKYGKGFYPNEVVEVEEII